MDLLSRLIMEATMNDDGLQATAKEKPMALMREVPYVGAYEELERDNAALRERVKALKELLQRALSLSNAAYGAVDEEERTDIWQQKREWRTDTKAALASGSEKDTRDLYNELIMAVACKFPGETRHQTALRYIMERESREVCGPHTAQSSGSEKEKP